MVRGYKTFKQFQESGEGIATNMLADRLKKLEASGIIEREVEPDDGRRVNYRLTQKGIDLAPVLLDLLIWGARHEQTSTSCSLILKMAKNRDEILAETIRRWRDRDSTPLIPQFDIEVAGTLAGNKKQGLPSPPNLRSQRNRSNAHFRKEHS
jgi:DNA-binding HxlR family transcriptional regulator